MLMGDKAKYLGLIFGICFATFLMSQQVSIFVGILVRTASQIEDVTEADIWVMDKQVRYYDEGIPMSDFRLYQVRGVKGVEWAVPHYRSFANIKAEKKNVQQVMLIGVDDTTMVAHPPNMVIGDWMDLKKPESLILDSAGWEYIWGDDPFEYGREVELNEKLMHVVGICDATPPFMTFPVVFTRYSEALKLVPQARNAMSFILAKSKPGEDPAQVAKNIEGHTGLQAHTADDFRWKSIDYYMERTGIPINFGITIFLGFIIGAAIAGQTFYIFVTENIKQFGALKAIGVTNAQILKMVLLQAIFVAVLGYSIGIGLTATFFTATSHVTALKGIYLLPQTMIITALAISGIVILASLVSIRKALVIDPAIVFRG